MEKMYDRIKSLFSPQIANTLISKVENKEVNYWDAILFEEFEINCPKWISDLSYDKYRKGADESFYNLVWKDATKVSDEIKPIGRYIKSTFTAKQINELIDIIKPS